MSKHTGHEISDWWYVGDGGQTLDTYIICCRSLHSHRHAQSPIMILAVDVVKVGLWIPQYAFTYSTIVSCLYKHATELCNHAFFKIVVSDFQTDRPSQGTGPHLYLHPYPILHSSSINNDEQPVYCRWSPFPCRALWLSLATAVRMSLIAFGKHKESSGVPADSMVCYLWRLVFFPPSMWGLRWSLVVAVQLSLLSALDVEDPSLQERTISQWCMIS